MKLKAHIASDIHLEFGAYQFPSDLDCDIIIIAGDTSNNDAHEDAMLLYEKAMDDGHTILHVLGNHEYYDSSIHDIVQQWRDFESTHRGSYHLLNNDRVTIKGQSFIGTTLWGHTPHELEILTMYSMNDYRCIKTLDEEGELVTLNPWHTNKMHSENRKYLADNMQKDDVLITHHAPTWNSVSPTRKHVANNHCYVGDIAALIEERQPKLAIHGHMHSPVDYMAHKTRVISNPRGYASYEGTDNFNSAFGERFVVDV